jgi:hypothetical protein
MADNPNSANWRSRGWSCRPSTTRVFFEFSAEGAPPVGAAFFDFIATFYASLLAFEAAT